MSHSQILFLSFAQLSTWCGCVLVCAEVRGAVRSQVLSFDDEKMLLEAWADFVRTVDCDMITGYNIMNFDIPFLIDRAKTLRCKNFAYLGRIPNRMTKLTETKFTSKAFGTRENKDINLDGRLKFDLLQVTSSPTSDPHGDFRLAVDVGVRSAPRS